MDDKGRVVAAEAFVSICTSVNISEALIAFLIAFEVSSVGIRGRAKPSARLLLRREAASPKYKKK